MAELSRLLFVAILSSTIVSCIGVKPGDFTLQAGAWKMGKAFQDAFGISPRMCCVVWDRCHLGQVDSILPKHLLWALCFLKVYAMQRVLVIMMGNPYRQVFHGWVWVVLKAIADSSSRVVSTQNNVVITHPFKNLTFCIALEDPFM